MQHREGELTFEQTRSVESRCRIHPDIVRGAGDRFKLELADGLSVTLPMQLARELLRPLVSEAGLNRVQEALREDSALSGDVWLKRLKQVHAKLIGGDPLHLAEIVRDGARREQRLSASGTTSKLSLREKGLCVKARQHLERSA